MIESAKPLAAIQRKQGDDFQSKWVVDLNA